MNHTEEGTIAVGALGSAMRRIMTPPEPEVLTPLTHYNISTNTPWGQADSVRYYGKGIVQYTTPSHGGFHVSEGLLKRMPEYMQMADAYADGTQGWFEEDVAWAIVVVCFPDRFSFQVRQDAVGTMHNYYAEAWAKFCAERSEMMPDSRME